MRSNSWRVHRNGGTQRFRFVGLPSKLRVMWLSRIKVLGSKLFEVQANSMVSRLSHVQAIQAVARVGLTTRASCDSEVLSKNCRDPLYGPYPLHPRFCFKLGDRCGKSETSTRVGQSFRRCCEVDNSNLHEMEHAQNTRDSLEHSLAWIVSWYISVPKIFRNR